MYRLRELERKDIEIINRWRNDPALIECLGAPFRFINMDVDQRWYDQYMNARNSCVRCAVVDESDEILGLVSLMSIDNVNRSAHLHIMIGGAENRGKGIGTFAVKALISHAFNNLNLRRIELGVLTTNAAAIRLYEKTGFVREGVKRQCVYKNGKYVDQIMMGLLRSDFVGADAEKENG
jgi:UDP-4-amino-4,6-dideoxy-N-acetyl-beta-L-altrosamine N-acetyltransferase